MKLSIILREHASRAYMDYPETRNENESKINFQNDSSFYAFRSNRHAFTTHSAWQTAFPVLTALANVQSLKIPIQPFQLFPLAYFSGIRSYHGFLLEPHDRSIKCKYSVAPQLISFWTSNIPKRERRRKG